MTTFARQKGTIHTSHLEHHLVFLGTPGQQENVLKESAREFEKATEWIRGVMKSRCEGVNKFFAYNEPGVFAGTCVVHPKRYLERLEQEQNELPGSPEPGTLAHIAQQSLSGRKQAIQAFWTYPRLDIPCDSSLKNGSYRVAYGKIDHLCMQPLCTNLLTALFRWRLAASHLFVSQLGFPGYRIEMKREIISEDGVEKSRGLSHLNGGHGEQGGATVVLHSFLRYPEGIFLNGGKRYKYLHDLVNWLQVLSCGDDYSWVKPEAFLTLSHHYPVMLRTEFPLNRVHELSSFLSYVRSAIPELVCYSSSIMSFNLPHSQDQDASIECAEEPVDGKPLPFRLLLKIDDGKDDRHAAEIAAYLYRKGLCVPHEETPGGQSEGDASVEIVAAMLKEKVIIRRYGRPFFWDIQLEFSTRRPAALLREIALTIRNWEGVRFTATVPLFDDNTPSPEDIAKIARTTTPQLKTKTSSLPYPTIDKELLERVLGNIPCVVPDPSAMHLDPPPPAEDILNLQLFELVEKYIWLKAYIEQLRLSWDNINEIHRQQQTLPAAFGQLLEYVDEQLNNLDSAITSSKKQYFNLSGHWTTLSRARQFLQKIAEAVTNITSEYNARLEGFQIVAMAEPFVKIGEQSGVMELLPHAIGALFRHYRGHPRNPSLETPEKWKVLVASASGKDYSLLPAFRMLFLPVDLKFCVHGKLPLIAHEVAHYLLFLLQAHKGSFTTTKDLWDKVGGQALHQAPKLFPFLKPEDIVSAFDRIHDLYLYTHEMLADILAGLAAGPVFFRCLHRMGFEGPLASRQASRPYSRQTHHHPPMALRLLLGRSMGRILWRIGPNEDDENDLWEIDKPLLQSFYQHDYRSHEKYCDQSAAPTGQDDDEVDSSLDSLYHVCMYRALDEDPALLRSLMEFAVGLSQDFLFYPLPVDLADYPKVVRWVNCYCQELAERLAYNDEVITDAPIKYLVAASESPIVKRPLYSGSRVIHGIWYNDPVESFRAMKCRLQEETGVILR